MATAHSRRSRLVTSSTLTEYVLFVDDLRTVAARDSQTTSWYISQINHPCRRCRRTAAAPSRSRVAAAAVALRPFVDPLSQL